MYLGIVADDFTGGTDIAGFVVQNGLSVTQFIGVPEADFPAPDAAVVSLKSRSCPAEDAKQESLLAMNWLLRQGCSQIFFKYCSTFDSTAKGNIGPVTDALMTALDSSITVMAPALPVNGRTVYCGYLFVNGVPLQESGMRHHPVTPMLDANLMRLTEAQAEGKAANIPAPVIDAGEHAVRMALEQMQKQGIRYAVPDTLCDAHLTTLANAVSDLPLVTGGSGLGGAIARILSEKHGLGGKNTVQAGSPPGGRSIVFSGSASVATNLQVADYAEKAASYRLDIGRCVADAKTYALRVAEWVVSLPRARYAPMVYATTGPEELAHVQREFGAEVSGLAVETLFASLAVLLRNQGVDHFIVAGGETSGAVVKSLGIKAFHIGPQIVPGVPWVRAVDQPVSLALKSGNFGEANFFSIAQEFYA